MTQNEMSIEAIKYLDEHWDPSMEVSAKERTRLYVVVFGMHLANKTNDIHSVIESSSEMYCKGDMKLGTGCGKCKRCLNSL